VETMFMQGAQGAPFGDAVMAGVALGVFEDYHVVKGWLRCSDQTRPDPARRALYGRLFELYLRLYESQRANFDELGRIMDGGGRG
jgi:sugar (pentulose or hexulose) kinase